MAEKFGLDFTVVDSGRCAQVRRDFGSAANPFAVYPLRRALTDDETEDALISLAEAAKNRDELVQYRRDRQSWEQRLAGLRTSGTGNS